jgi:hypothetical protein
MTEEEWLTTGILYNMLLRSSTLWNHRKLWLFGCACFRRQWHLLVDHRARQYVDTAERHVDGNCSDSEMDTAWELFDTAWRDDSLASDGHLDIHRAMRQLTGIMNSNDSFYLASRVADGFASFATKTQHTDTQGDWDDEKLANWKSYRQHETRMQTDLLRDIFGNPIRPVTLNPTWQTETVVALATAIYADKAFDRMPILADALEDAGCDNADVLSHCRGEGPHVRGCWVVDLLLGKE